MKTWLVVVGAAILGVVAGLGSGIGRIFWAPWDGTPEGVAGPQLTGPAATSNEFPIIEVDADKYDFGVMESSATGKHAFLFRNVGNARATLEKGDTTCRCTMTSMDKTSLAPGESTTVTVEWHGRNFFGPYRQSASVLTNDRHHQRVTLTITGRISAAVKAVPNELVFSSIAAGVGETGTVQLFHYQENEPFKVEGYELSDKSLGNRFEVRFEPMPADQLKKEPDAKAGYVMQVSAKPGLPLGPIQQTITVDFGRKATPSLAIPVRGKVVSDVSIAGWGWDSTNDVLTLGTITTQEEIERTILIHARGPHVKDIRLKVVSVEPDLLQVALGPTITVQGRGMTQTPLTVRIPKGSRPADYLGSETAKPGRITLETGLPDASQLQIRVRFAVRN